jgi:hypothetical protein
VIKILWNPYYWPAFLMESTKYLCIACGYTHIPMWRVLLDAWPWVIHWLYKLHKPSSNNRVFITAICVHCYYSALILHRLIGCRYFLIVWFQVNLNSEISFIVLLRFGESNLIWNVFVLLRRKKSLSTSLVNLCVAMLWKTLVKLKYINKKSGTASWVA